MVETGLQSQETHFRPPVKDWWEEDKNSKNFHFLPQFLAEVKSFLKEGMGALYTAYNLGCGEKLAPDGWINVDMRPQCKGIVRSNFINLGNPAETIDRILCIHALEHVTVREALKALQIWRSKLKPGGELLIAVPDLEGIFRALMTPNAPYELLWWYRFCLFGYQADQNHPVSNGELNVQVNPYELHLCGWTARMLEMDLVKAGYTVKYINKYDGYGTPSLFARAIK